VQIASLQQAAQAGLVQLTPKGDFFGDSVAVDLKGARIPGHPVRITVRIEFLGAQPNGQPFPASTAQTIAKAIENRIGTMKASDGSTVTLDVDVRLRTGTNPESGGTPGYHQIELFVGHPHDGSFVSPKPFGPTVRRAASGT
jgi:hypothetical protein